LSFYSYLLWAFTGSFGALFPILAFEIQHTSGMAVHTTLFFISVM